MRIIAGKHRGRKIEMRRDVAHIRPTSNFAREAIFNIISHGSFAAEENSPLRGKRVLDVFCGSGAFGLEALSRGAAHVTFVDSARESLALAHSNAEHMNELANVEFVKSDATMLPRARKAFSLIFVDPPYGSKLLDKALASLMNNGWFEPDALIIVEHEVREHPPIPEALHCIDQRRYGRATVSLYRLSAAN